MTNTQYLFLASYRAECYRHSFPTLRQTRNIYFLASYGVECYRHSVLTLKTNTQHLFLASICKSGVFCRVSNACSRACNMTNGTGFKNCTFVKDIAVTLQCCKIQGWREWYSVDYNFSFDFSFRI